MTCRKASPVFPKTEKSTSLSGTGSFRVIMELHSACNLAAAQAAGAHVDVLGRAVDDGLDALHVGLPGTVGTSVRVADLDTEGNALVAEFALRHG